MRRSLVAPLGRERMLRLGAAARGLSGGDGVGQPEDRADIYVCELEQVPFKSLSFLVFTIMEEYPLLASLG